VENHGNVTAAVRQSGRTPAAPSTRFDTPGPTASSFTIMSDVDPATIDELKSRFRGEIVDSSDPGYDEARAVWNATVDKRPGVIARCADTEDVVASVAFARGRVWRSRSAEGARASPAIPPPTAGS
jgi:hypothetical protein